jgi:hypothetical protein
MPVSSIAQILIRLFALNMLLLSLVHIASLFSMPGPFSFYFYTIGPSLVHFAAFVAFWFGAPKLSRLLTRGNDGHMNLEGVTERQLYSTGFLILGLYFAMDSFASVFSWIHYFSVHESSEFGFHQKEAPSYYSLTEEVMTLIAGVGLILSAQTWATKLTQNSASPHD